MPRVLPIARASAPDVADLGAGKGRKEAFGALAPRFVGRGGEGGANRVEAFARGRVNASTLPIARASGCDVADLLAGDTGIAAGLAFVADLAARLRSGGREAGQAGRRSRR